ncbi:hypothetical protein OG453_28515 [Streptomyces sp. NBC_01381]|uniref:hypothetical protein n=1 Tax=Streptomyces sp. NBC_01381 TaxID=2903845 RepID=UPI0022559E9A|nr:hypothetical protein [Streptomyces sp. NBC_01381]MCX4670589.1 hypothetical protein [Streptomyces sp. NBC_01381]
MVTAVAGGRAKSRQLAKALAIRPAVLTDGRSPAAQAIGDLLIGLRKAGASAIAPEGRFFDVQSFTGPVAPSFRHGER